MYHQNYYKPTGIDLSRQTNATIFHQIIFTGQLGENNVSAILIMAVKQDKTILNFPLELLNVTD